MIVLSEVSLRAAMIALVSATHGCTDHHGRPRIVGTIDDKRLRSAALAAIQQITGEIVWPADERLAIDPDEPLIIAQKRHRSVA